MVFSRGRGDRTPVNGFGDRRTTAVLFPYLVGCKCITRNECYYSTGPYGKASAFLKNISGQYKTPAGITGVLRKGEFFRKLCQFHDRGITRMNTVYTRFWYL